MKLLFVVTAFYPEQAIGSVRTTKFVKFLERAGHDVHVISLAPARWAPRDESLRFPGIERISWKIIPQGRLFERIFARMRSAVVGDRSALETIRKGGATGLSGLKRRVKSVAQLAYTTIKALDWMFQVRRHVRAELRDSRFDAIFTSYPSLASPLTGLMLKRMGLSRLLMIDFRDPISYGSSSRLSAGRLLERWLVRNAEATSYASAGVHAKIAGGRSECLGPAKIVTNGFDPDDLAEAVPPGNAHGNAATLNFAYVGALYGGKRDLAPFFRGVSEVTERHPGHALSIHYAGQEGAVFRAQASAHGLQDLVVDHGRINRKQSLGLQQAADVCVLATWNTPEDQGILTGKMFEYFLMRKPVLAIVNGTLAGSETRQVIEQVGAGFCFEEAAPGDMPAMVAWMEAVLREKAENGRITDRYTAAVNHFNIEAMVLDLFAQLGEGSQRATPC